LATKDASTTPPTVGVPAGRRLVAVPDERSVAVAIAWLVRVLAIAFVAKPSVLS
jgi:hypothetical protein